MDGWMSCHSCHTDGHTMGLRSDNLGDGTFGAPKRTPSLLGVRETGPYAWNGSLATLEEQIRKSVENTMQGPRKLTDEEVSDLAEFLRSLSPPAGLAELQAPGMTPELVERGEVVFADHGCAGCHQPPTFTSPGTRDVGLVDELGVRRFNPPSLRAVSQRSAFFHDNRAVSLADVFTRWGHQVPEDIPAEDVEALVAFLCSL
jgi:cytochrome c peroxidase